MTNVYKYISDTKFYNVINIILINSILLQVAIVSKSGNVICVIATATLKTSMLLIHAVQLVIQCSKKQV